MPITKEQGKSGQVLSDRRCGSRRLAILDSANLLYELEQSRQEMLEQLGPKYVFSAECPYGTENERVMKYALKIYPALRNRMPEPFLEELNRGSDKTPGSSLKEYVQWQRGALTDTPMDLMKSWIDTCSAKNNIRLVLVFHGVEGIGWEYDLPLTLKTYVTDSSGKISVKQGNADIQFQAGSDSTGSFILYRLVPNTEPAKITFK